MNVGLVFLLLSLVFDSSEEREEEKTEEEEDRQATAKCFSFSSFSFSGRYMQRINTRETSASGRKRASEREKRPVYSNEKRSPNFSNE